MEKLTGNGSGSPALPCSLGLFYRGSDGEPICATCHNEAQTEECLYCEDGFDGHDCGEDCCCCEYPEENRVCEMCRGRGLNIYCENEDCQAFELFKCVAAPDSIGANVKGHAIRPGAIADNTENDL